MKANNRDLAKRIIQDGEIIKKTTIQYVITYMIVRNFGHTYGIRNPFGRCPEITQMD